MGEGVVKTNINRRRERGNMGGEGKRPYGKSEGRDAWWW